MRGIKKYQPELGMMKECGAGQYVKLYDYRDLEKKFFGSNARIAELEKQIEKAEKVVEFYGAKENWRDEADSGVKVFGPFKDHKTWTDCGYEYDWENLNDQGEKAREYFTDKEKK